MTTAASPIVVFDGTCYLCSRAVRFILANERDRELRFAAAQSAAGQSLLSAHGCDPQTLTTLVVIEGGAVRLRSDAALAVARHLRWPWRMFRCLRWMPRPLRDALYRWVAGNRHRWFGKRECCLVPTPETRSRFLEVDDLPRGESASRPT